MNINLSNRLYKQGDEVYFGYNQLTVHDQRGRLFVKFKGKQINLKNIPVLPEDKDPVFDYVFGGLFQNFSCPAVDYWIMRHRMKRKISINEYKKQFVV